MSKFFKSIFGALSDKPWEKDQMISDNLHQGKTFELSNQTSAVIVIFGVSTVLFTLIVTGYLYSIPVNQDTQYLLEPNLLWVNTFILLLVTFFFNKVTRALKKNNSERIKPNLLIVGQPTRGVDIGAIEFIHKQLVELRDRGKAILLVSVELDEILSLSDKIIVMLE